MQELRVETERVDDLPLLLKQLEQMGVADVINAVAEPHGNRQGLSVGWLTATWLSYVVSQADHRMSEVEAWAAAHLETLRALVPEAVEVRDFTDDRLADVLKWLAEGEQWEAVEQALGQRLVRVYELEAKVVRLDSTAAAVFHEVMESMLFAFGHSKDHRPDLAQLKLMLAALDPMGLPLATLVVAGNQADDGLYQPALERAGAVLGQGGKLYLGDSKMGALATRAFIQSRGDFYLAPLARIGEAPELLEQLLEAVWSGEQPLEPVWVVVDEEEVQTPLQALGYEVQRPQQATVEGRPVSWQERVLAIYSLDLARQQRRGLAQRLGRARAAIEALTPPPGRGRRPWEDREALQARVEGILRAHRVEGLLQVSYHQEVTRRVIRKYGERPARVEEQGRWVVQARPDPEAVHQARRRLGWRLLVCNAPAAQLSLAQAVVTQRQSPRIEHCFSRLKGCPLGLRPLYVRRDDHACGLAHLLSLALRVLTLLDYGLARALQAAGETLAGLYAGNPQRTTAHPTAERVLRAFRNITLSVVHLPDRIVRHLTPLSPLQQRILTLLGWSADLYERLAQPPNPIPAYVPLK